MIEDLQDEISKSKEKVAELHPLRGKLLSVFLVWFIFTAVFFLFCLPGIKTTFNNKTKEQFIKEAREYAQLVETRTMKLAYICPDGQSVKLFNLKVPTTGAGLYNDALEGLLSDTPSEVLEQMCINAIPKGCTLKSVVVKDKKANLSFTFNPDLESLVNRSIAKLQIQATMQAINPDLTDFEIFFNDTQI